MRLKYRLGIMPGPWPAGADGAAFLWDLVDLCEHTEIDSLWLSERLSALLQRLVSESEANLPQGVYYVDSPLARKGQVAVCFPGQGSQTPNMLRQLAIEFPPVREVFERADRCLAEALSRPLSEFIFPPPAFTEDERRADTAALKATEVAQPALAAADVAIWTREPGQTDLIRRMLFTSRVRAFASTQYVRKFGAPKTLEELDQHRIVSYSGQPAQHLTAITWIETAGRDGKGPREPAFRANSVVALRYAIRAGIGIGMIPDYMTDNEADLVPVLTEIDPPTLPILFCYPEELKSSKKVQVLRDFLVAQARQWKF